MSSKKRRVAKDESDDEIDLNGNNNDMIIESAGVSNKSPPDASSSSTKAKHTNRERATQKALTTSASNSAVLASSSKGANSTQAIVDSFAKTRVDDMRVKTISDWEGIVSALEEHYTERNPTLRDDHLARIQSAQEVLTGMMKKHLHDVALRIQQEVQSSDEFFTNSEAQTSSKQRSTSKRKFTETSEATNSTEAAWDAQPKLNISVENERWEKHRDLISRFDRLITKYYLWAFSSDLEVLAQKSKLKARRAASQQAAITHSEQAWKALRSREDSASRKVRVDQKEILLYISEFGPAEGHKQFKEKLMANTLAVWGHDLAQKLESDAKFTPAHFKSKGNDDDDDLLNESLFAKR